jgi:predicted DCC family thiol-disulfide oxidoreductase YuxK
MRAIPMSDIPLPRDARAERSNEEGTGLLRIGATSYLLFDGECGLCTAFAHWARGRDRRGRFTLLPYQAVSAEALARVGLTPERCAQRLYVITRRGRVWGGVFGINAFFFHLLPWRFLVLAIYALPPLLLLEMALYALVAKYRHRLSRWLGLNACRAS